MALSDLRKEATATGRIGYPYRRTRGINRVAERAGAWIVHDAAMERILYTAAPVIHPALFEQAAERVITV